MVLRPFYEVAQCCRPLLTVKTVCLWHDAGHSLGGALAILAAYDIQQAFGFRNLHVYTYGAPRVGNHRFAREYNDTVPNTWTVINDKARQ